MQCKGYRTYATIDVDRLAGNVKKIRAKLPRFKNPVKILAIVKANAYGHGAKEIAKVLKSEESVVLGVASIEEARELEKIGLPIVILSPVNSINIPWVIKSGFIPTISNIEFAKELNNAAHRGNKKVKAYVEIDTGMIRTGVPWEKGIEFISDLMELRNIRLEGIFTHLSEPENIRGEFTFLQLERFKKIIKGLEHKGIKVPLVHTASSAAILSYPSAYFNMVRPGILLYGLYPSSNIDRSIMVEPIMGLHTRVCQINDVPGNTGISYGRTYVTKGRRKIATLLVGYGDGYPRALSNKGEVIIKGKRARIVGSVCMDLTMVDVTGMPVNIGDEVTLIGKEKGEEISASEVAKLSGTINYEITTRISPRVPRVYLRNNRTYKIHSLLGEETVR